MRAEGPWLARRLPLATPRSAPRSGLARLGRRTLRASPSRRGHARRRRALRLVAGAARQRSEGRRGTPHAADRQGDPQRVRERRGRVGLAPARAASQPFTSQAITFWGYWISVRRSNERTAVAAWPEPATSAAITCSSTQKGSSCRHSGWAKIAT